MKSSLLSWFTQGNEMIHCFSIIFKIIRNKQKRHETQFTKVIRFTNFPLIFLWVTMWGSRPGVGIPSFQTPDSLLSESRSTHFFSNNHLHFGNYSCIQLSNVTAQNKRYVRNVPRKESPNFSITEKQLLLFRAKDWTRIRVWTIVHLLLVAPQQLFWGSCREVRGD